MQETRYREAPQREMPREIPRETFRESGRSSGGGVGKLLYKIILLLAIATLIILAPKIIQKTGLSSLVGGGDITLIDPSIYTAVFLVNGQVYFGHIVSSNENEMVLKEVYYLQTTGATDLNPADQTRFTLIKLGQEVHGPENELYINRNQILFHEKLRDDSRVVQSIKAQE